MSFSTVILVLSLVTLLHDLHVTGCAVNCTDEPKFTPPALVVKFGDKASVDCSVCPQCADFIFDLEIAVGVKTRNGTRLTWSVDILTEWDLEPQCYYNDKDDNQCCSDLPLTVYRPPDNVSFSFRNDTGPVTGPVTAGQNYTMYCQIENVAPVENLEVVFYRGNSPLPPLRLTNETPKTPLTRSFPMAYVPLKGDNGVDYWCMARLNLGPYGPQPPVVVESQKSTSVVYYKPELQVRRDLGEIILTEGDKLQLNCTSVGNPSPSYNWTLPSGRLSPSTGSVFMIESVAAEHSGKYICHVSNNIWSFPVEYSVEVQRDFTAYIIAAIVIAVVLLIIVGIFLYRRYYAINRTGKYNLRDVFRLRPRHSPVSTAE
ncbi:neurotrimin-like [Xyrichtys novacula]|uniref:Neurotrimin-like n=1 Tax=Xyrichtys novacula TaxID=13765 RepID=A0AAV1EZI6_XYRNO|nr:neurotrimin-like [Xyrichtys novacula]